MTTRSGPGEEIAELLRDVNAALREHFAQHALRAGFPWPSRRIPLMREVLKEPGITINELARRTDMAKSQVSTIVAELEGEGMLRKEDDDADRRLARVFPTTEGKSRAERWKAGYKKVLASTLRSLSAEETDHLLEGLRALRRALALARSLDAVGN